MTEYIFYTTEGFTQAPDGEDIENCQLLGRAYGKDKHDALSNLLNENPWIKERGFEPSEAISQELASTANAEAKLSFLTNLLDERQFAEYTKWLITVDEATQRQQADDGRVATASHRSLGEVVR